MIIVGGGTIGLAAAYHAARRGLRVTLIDRYPVPESGGPNDLGSSRGLERMFRILYSQPERVRLVETAYAMWHELEQQVSSDPKDRILAEQDLLFFGNPDVTTFEGNINDIARTMDGLGIPYDRLDGPDAIARRYPIFRPEALRTPDGTDYVGLVQNAGATINVQRAFQVVRALAGQTGRVRTVAATVTSIASELPGDWVVTTDDGTRHHAGHLIVCPGVWLGGVLAPFGLKPAAAWSIWQMSLAYFPRGPAGASTHWPIWYEFGNTKADADRLFYGFPDVGFTPDTTGRLKISADYTYQKFAEPQAATRTFDPRLIGDIQRHLGQLLQPGVLAIDRPTLEQACLYSMSPDGDMVLGRIPVAPESAQSWPNAAMFVMASGRGFKYTPLFGRILVDLAVTGKTAYQLDLEAFSPRRAGIFEPARQ